MFHQDVLTIRSHQWKYYVEPYSGCTMRCTYCLHWRSPAYLESIQPAPDLLDGLDGNLAAMRKKQIVYVGYNVDPYQSTEQGSRATRQILERIALRDLPVVILTKSPLILRDMDLLLDLSRRGLVLAQFTVLTTNQEKARIIERGAPAVAARLKAASNLAAAGIPVHFHLSPVIPGFYDDGELSDTVRAIAEHGGQCIYSNILGMRHLNTKVWLESVEKLQLRDAEKTRSAYARPGDPAKKVYSPDIGLIFEEMSRLSGICTDNHIDFICEFIPGLDAFDSSRFETGIFRFGLPAVYQMVRAFETPPTRKNWNGFVAYLRARFEALDDEYLGLVKEFWDNGQLFENTTIAGEAVNGGREYFPAGRLRLANDSVLAWD